MKTHRTASPFAALGGGGYDFYVLLEAVILAGGICLGGCGLAQQVAQINEMLVAGGALGELRFGPLRHEFFGCHPACPIGHQDDILRHARANAKRGAVGESEGASGKVEVHAFVYYNQTWQSREQLE